MVSIDIYIYKSRNTQFIGGERKMANVTIYTTPTCTYCKMTKAFFKENNVEYQEIDVAADQSKAQAMFEKSGQMGVPVVEVDGKIIVGFDKEALKQALGM